MAETGETKTVTGFRARYCDEVVAFMGQGYSLTAFAGEIGVSRAKLDKWVREKRAFAAAVDRAQAARARRLESEVFKSKGSAAAGVHLQALRIAAPDEWPEPGVRAVAQGRGKPQPQASIALPDNGRE